MGKILIPALTALLVVAAMAYQGKSVDPVLTEAPAITLGELAGFTSQEVPVSEAELTVLPSDTGFVKRQYEDAEGRTFLVSVVIGGRSKSSVHRPELCLPSQGFQMMAPHDMESAGVDWHVVSLARRDATSMMFAYTFFNQEGYRTSSHVRRILRDVWDRSVLGRIDRWMMVTVYASVADDATLKEFLGKIKGVVVR